MEFTNQPPASKEAFRQVEHSVQPGCERHIFEWANLDEVKAKSPCRDESRLHSTWRANEENLCSVLADEFVSDRQRRNDMATGAAPGNQDAEVSFSFAS